MKKEKKYKEYNHLIKESLTDLAKNNEKFQKLLGIDSEIPKAVEENLNIARQYSIFENEAFNVSTIKKITEKKGEEEKSFTEYSINLIIDPFSESGRSELEKIGTEKSPEWVTSQSTFCQNLLTRNKENMKSGMFPIPTQAKDQIAFGLRNAYLTDHYLAEEKEGQTPVFERTSEIIRQGSSTYNNGLAGNKDLIKLNMERLKELESGHIVDLSSGHEKTRDFQTVAKSEGMICSNANLDYRRLTEFSTDFTGTRKVVEDTKGFLKGTGIIEEGKTLDQTIDQLRLDCKDLKKDTELYKANFAKYQVLKSLKELEELSSSGGLDLTKKNLDVVANLEILNHFLREPVFADSFKDDETYKTLTKLVAINCKSGKDRTTGQAHKITTESSSIYVGKSFGDLDYQLSDDSKTRIAASLEDLTLAGINGGTMGSTAIKDKHSTKLTSPLPESLRPYSQEPVAHTNSKAKSVEATPDTISKIDPDAILAIINISSEIISEKKAIEQAALAAAQQATAPATEQTTPAAQQATAPAAQQEEERRPSLSDVQKIRKTIRNKLRTWINGDIIPPPHRSNRRSTKAEIKPSFGLTPESSPQGASTDKSQGKGSGLGSP